MQGSIQHHSPVRSPYPRPRLILSYFALDDIIPHIEHLQSIQIVQVILYVELVEP